MRGTPSPEPRSFSAEELRRLLVIPLRRRRGLFLGIIVVCLLSVLLVTLTERRRYRAVVEIALTNGNDEAQLATVHSPLLAARVLAALSPGQLSSLSALDPFVRMMRASGCPRLSSADVKRELIGCLQQNVAVAHPADTLALTIGFEANDPSVAAKVANAFARAYLADVPGRAEDRIIHLADTATSPVAPHLFIRLGVALIFGVILGASAAVLTERKFDGLTDGSEVRSRLWLNYLGSVPLLGSVLPVATSVEDAVVRHPRSALAEAFRNLVDGLDRFQGEHCRTMAICSALPSEGSTTIAICLARVLALSGASIVLVDCDGRRGIGAMPACAGSGALIDLLGDAAALKDSPLRDVVSGATILPFTLLEETETSGSALIALIARLRDCYDHVLILVGPLTSRQGAYKAIQLAESTIVVTRWRSTSSRLVSSSVDQLRAEGVRIAGAVLNFVDYRKQARYSLEAESAYQSLYSQYYS